MLLERDLIQSIGFRNVSDGGEVTGFQLGLRMQSYRGMTASLAVRGARQAASDLRSKGGRA